MKPAPQSKPSLLRRPSRATTAGLLVCLIALLGIAPTLSCDRADASEPQTFRFINRGDIFTLDLNQMSYLQDFRITYAMREGLYSPTGPEFAPEPAGAVRHELSADGRVYTFHLRKESRWSNGDPVVAGDYVFSWRRLLEDPGEYTYLFYAIKGAEPYESAFSARKPANFASVGIEAVDDHTLRVTLKRPVAYFLDLMAFPTFYPRHEPSMRKFARTDARTGRISYDNRYTRPPDVVTNGPFKLVKWEFKRVLRLEKNEHYWDQANVHLGAIENLINDNPLSMVLQFEAGAVDWISEVPNDLAADLKASGRQQLGSCTAFGTFFLTLYCKPTLPSSVLGGAPNPLADVRVRQALALAVDKPFVTEQITRMGEAVADTYIPPGTLRGYSSLPGLGRDVAKARQLLTDAGYPEGRGFPKLPILYNTENATRARIVQALKQQWKQNLGIDVEIEGIEGKIFRQRVSSKEYAIATVAWFGDYPDVATFTDKYLSTSLQNDSAWESPVYDKLLADAANELDPQKRFELLRRAEHMLNTEVPILPLYHYVNVTLIAPHVRGLSVNARNMIDWKRISMEAR